MARSNYSYEKKQREIAKKKKKEEKRQKKMTKSDVEDQAPLADDKDVSMDRDT